jgi:hypothetical protein
MQRGLEKRSMQRPHCARILPWATEIVGHNMKFYRDSILMTYYRVQTSYTI